MAGTKWNMDDFCYYKCKDCGKKYIGYPPEKCSNCTCRSFNLVMGEEWWSAKEGNRVLGTVER